MSYLVELDDLKHQEWERRYIKRLIQGGMWQTAATAEFANRYGDGRHVDLTINPEEAAKADLIDLLY